MRWWMIAGLLGMLLPAWGDPGAADAGVPASSKVRLGIDELEASGFEVLKGKRVGLVTNNAALSSDGRGTIDILYEAPEVNLVALFGPEHGLDGTARAGHKVKDEIHETTGLPVHSLYGKTRHPTPEMLEGLDVLVYDLQDIGSRSYTYISTLGYVMDAAREAGLEIVVLDRPNPLGGMRVQGARLDGVSSFVGLYNIPFVYGLTPAELAQWINDNYLEAPAKLTVIPMAGYDRRMSWEDTGLKWVPPSPKIPSVGAAFGYAAIGFIGEIGISNGVMTDTPFEVVNRGRVNPRRLASDFAALGLHGVRLEPHTFKSTVGPWKGSIHRGTRLVIDPAARANLPGVGYLIIDLMRTQLQGWDPFGRASDDQRSMFDKVTGSAKIREAIAGGTAAAEMIRSWREGEKTWREERRPYLLYPEPVYREFGQPPAWRKPWIEPGPDPIDVTVDEAFEVLVADPPVPSGLPTPPTEAEVELKIGQEVKPLTPGTPPTHPVVGE